MTRSRGVGKARAGISRSRGDKRRQVGGTSTISGTVSDNRERSDSPVRKVGHSIVANPDQIESLDVGSTGEQDVIPAPHICGSLVNLSPDIQPHWNNLVEKFNRELMKQPENFEKCLREAWEKGGIMIKDVVDYVKLNGFEGITNPNRKTLDSFIEYDSTNQAVNHSMSDLANLLAHKTLPAQTFLNMPQLSLELQPKSNVKLVDDSANVPANRPQMHSEQSLLAHTFLPPYMSKPPLRAVPGLLPVDQAFCKQVEPMSNASLIVSSLNMQPNINIKRCDPAKKMHATAPDERLENPHVVATSVVLSKQKTADVDFKDVSETVLDEFTGIFVPSLNQRLRGNNSEEDDYDMIMTITDESETNPTELASKVAPPAIITPIKDGTDQNSESNVESPVHDTEWNEYKLYKAENGAHQIATAGKLLAHASSTVVIDDQEHFLSGLDHARTHAVAKANLDDYGYGDSETDDDDAEYIHGKRRQIVSSTSASGSGSISSSTSENENPKPRRIQEPKAVVSLQTSSEKLSVVDRHVRREPHLSESSRSPLPQPRRIAEPKSVQESEHRYSSSSSSSPVRPRPIGEPKGKSFHHSRKKSKGPSQRKRLSASSSSSNSQVTSSPVWESPKKFKGKIHFVTGGTKSTGRTWEQKVYGKYPTNPQPKKKTKLMKKDEKQTKNKNASTAQVSAQPIASSSAQTFTRDAASTSMDAKLSADKSTPKEGPKSSLTESESDKDNTLGCPFNCGTTFTAQSSLGRHLKEIHRFGLDKKVPQKKFKCDVPGCGTKFIRKPDLKVHKNTIHAKNKKKVRCQYCSGWYSHSRSLKDHIRRSCKFKKYQDEVGISGDHNDRPDGQNTGTESSSNS